MGYNYYEKGVGMHLHGNRNKRSYITIGLAITLLVVVGVAGYFAKSYYELRANPGKAAESDTKHLTDAVGKLYDLPKDETPIVGKVSDKEKLKDQPFFKNAKNNDDVLIYQKARIAIIYRASETKLINVGPVAIDAQQQEPQQKTPTRK